MSSYRDRKIEGQRECICRFGCIRLAEEADAELTAARKRIGELEKVLRNIAQADEDGCPAGGRSLCLRGECPTVAICAARTALHGINWTEDTTDAN